MRKQRIPGSTFLFPAHSSAKKERLGTRLGLTIDPLRRIFGRFTGSNLGSIITPSFGVRTYSRASQSDFGSMGHGSMILCLGDAIFFLDLGDKTEIFSTGPAMMFLQLDSAAYTAELLTTML